MDPLRAAAILLLLAAAHPAVAREFATYPIGMPRIVHGLKVAPLYFQPIDLEGAMMHPSADCDIHLEADISATANDPDGYADGEWRPYLTVTYRLTKVANGQTLAGSLMPLVAYGGSTGASVGKAHYGDNLKLFGAGRYRLQLSVAPPDSGPTGAQASFAPFTVDYDFVYAGVGKKGAY